jgi:deazaflavin-dependent oxidoreductase (nitroreductase family)
MTTDSAEWNRGIIAEFRASGGAVARTLPNARLVLVHHTGARSGVERVAPLVSYTENDRPDRIYVFGSNAGADEHPAWYHNLVANPRTTVEFGAETFPVVARVLTGAERDDAYAKQSVLQPRYAEYRRGTSRVIPVVELRRVEKPEKDT